MGFNRLTGNGPSGLGLCVSEVGSGVGYLILVLVSKNAFNYALSFVKTREATVMLLANISSIS